jgi:hypothetical protein
MEAAQSQPEMPDVLLDPDAYNQHLASQVQDAVYTTRLQLGEELARTRYGDEVVEQALAWGVDRCDVDPVFNAEVKRARNPVAYAVEAWRKETALQRLGGVDPSEIEQFMAWKRAQAQVQAATPQPSAALAPASPQPAQPPRTLASSASAGPAAAPKVTKEQEQLARIFG